MLPKNEEIYITFGAFSEFKDGINRRVVDLEKLFEIKINSIEKSMNLLEKNIFEMTKNINELFNKKVKKEVNNLVWDTVKRILWICLAVLFSYLGYKLKN